MLSANQTVVKFLGWGVYEGHEVPGPGIGGTMGDVMRDLKMTNPKIRLESGKVVWGCECWWGVEDEVKKMMGNRTIESVDIDEVRKAIAS